MRRRNAKGVGRRPVRDIERIHTWMTELDGGDDLTTPVLKLDPKMTLFTRNYEADVQGEYSRCGNYERFDGRAKPSDASYWTLDFDAGTAEFLEGETVTGAISGATGQVMAFKKISYGTGTQKFQVGGTLTGADSGATSEIVWVTVDTGSWRGGDAVGYLYLKDVSGTYQSGETVSSPDGLAVLTGVIEDIMVESGSWAGNDAAGTLYLTMVTDDFQDNEAITSASGSATTADDSIANGAGTEILTKAALMHAISAHRDDIGSLTGSGIIRGLMSLSGTLYALRDNAGGTAMDLWKSSTSGWVQVTLPDYLDFDGGSGAFTEGDTLTGGISGATATIDAVVIKSGTTGASNQAGRLYLSSVSGTFQNNETITDTGGGSAVADGIVTTLTLTNGGYLETVVYNFTGDPANNKIYGVDGVNDAFEFDGTNYYSIPSTITSVKPDHVAAHKNYLFLSYGPSIRHSGLGTPRDWTAISGAVELATGDDVTGFAKAPGDMLVTFNRSATYLMYGESATDWNRKQHSDEVGAIERSVQRAGKVIYLDDQGLMSLAAVQDYGDFKETSISKAVDPVITSLKSNVLASMRVKAKNQYRIFFDDGTGYHVRIDRKKPAFTRVDYGKTVYTCLSTEDSEGNEILFFGSDDGYVYQLDVGRSADGEPIEAYLRTPYWHLDNPRTRKAVKQAIVQVDAEAGTEIEFTPEFDYGSAEKPRGRTEDFSVASGGGYWDVATWGEFIWDGQVVGEATAYIDGTGRNVSLLIGSYSAHETNHTLESIILYYFKRGFQR